MEQATKHRVPSPKERAALQLLQGGAPLVLLPSGRGRVRTGPMNFQLIAPALVKGLIAAGWLQRNSLWNERGLSTLPHYELSDAGRALLAGQEARGE